MPHVHLPSQLRELASGEETLELSGGTVGEVLQELVARYPKTNRWVTDETGAIRRHVRVFVNGEQRTLGDAVAERDEVRILPAISGGDR